MKFRLVYYKTIVSIFEKYGFTVVPSTNLVSIIVMNTHQSRTSMTMTDIFLIIDYEDIGEFIVDVERSPSVGYVISIL